MKKLEYNATLWSDSMSTNLRFCVKKQCSKCGFRQLSGLLRWPIFALLIIALNTQGAEQTFSNPNPIVIQDNTAGSPYPSTIAVSGIAEAVEKITVTISNLSHAHPQDVDIVLVGPGGESALLLSDAGGVPNGNPGIMNVTLEFDD